MDSSDSSSQGKSFRERLRSVFRVNDTPHRVALAFSIGVFLAFFPVVGLHTLMAVAVAWVGRLSFPVILAGTFVNNPWTIAPIYGGSFWFGLFLTGRNLPAVRVDWSGKSFASLWGVLKPVLLPFCVGAIVAGALAGLIAYWAVRPIVRAYQTSRSSREPSTT